MWHYREHKGSAVSVEAVELPFSYLRYDPDAKKNLEEQNLPSNTNKILASADHGQVGNGGEAAQSIPRVNGTVQTNGLSVAADDGP